MIYNYFKKEKNEHEIVNLIHQIFLKKIIQKFDKYKIK